MKLAITCTISHYWLNLVIVDSHKDLWVAFLMITIIFFKKREKTQNIKVDFCWKQARRWPDLNLKSPGIKARHLSRQHGPPQPLAVTGGGHNKHDDGSSHDDSPTPRTPLTVPHTPPPHHHHHHHHQHSSSDYSVFAQIHIGQGIPLDLRALVILYETET